MCIRDRYKPHFFGILAQKLIRKEMCEVIAQIFNERGKV